jgi:hypothetical protein
MAKSNKNGVCKPLFYFPVLDRAINSEFADQAVTANGARHRGPGKRVKHLAGQGMNPPFRRPV